MTRVLAIVVVAVTWLLWTAGPAAACTVSYQSGPAGAVCGGAVPAVAAGAVAAVALVSAVAVVAIRVRSGQAVDDVAYFARALTGSAAENLTAVQDEIVRRYTAGDPAIRALYKNDTKGRVVRRRDAGTTIAGFPLPAVERCTERGFRVKPAGAPDAIPAVFRTDGSGVTWELSHGRSGLDAELLEAADWLTQYRYENLKNLAAARHGTGLAERSDFTFLASRWGERLGEYAGVHAAQTVLQQRFPGHELERLLVGELGGAGALDDIYRVVGPSGPVGMLVLETKGPEATQGARYGLDGVHRYEQGHPEYLNTVIEVMRASGRSGTVPDELAAAVTAKTLGYFYVRAVVTGDGGGLSSAEMTKPRLEELWRQADEAVSAVREQRPGLTDEEAERIHREVRTAAVHGTAAYAGFRLKQFDIGLNWP